jgi:hypothetical protein
MTRKPKFLGFDGLSLGVIIVINSRSNYHRLSRAFSMVREGNEGNESFLAIKFSGAVPADTTTIYIIFSFIENNLHKYHFLHGRLILLHLEGEVFNFFRREVYHFLHRGPPDQRSLWHEESCTPVAVCCCDSHFALKSHPFGTTLRCMP